MVINYQQISHSQSKSASDEFGLLGANPPVYRMATDFSEASNYVGAHLPSAASSYNIMQKHAMMAGSNSKQRLPHEFQAIAPSIALANHKPTQQGNTIGVRQAVNSERSHVPILPHLNRKLEPNAGNFVEGGDLRQSKLSSNVLEQQSLLRHELKMQQRTNQSCAQASQAANAAAASREASFTVSQQPVKYQLPESLSILENRSCGYNKSTDLGAGKMNINVGTSELSCGASNIRDNATAPSTCLNTTNRKIP